MGIASDEAADGELYDGREEGEERDVADEMAGGMAVQDVA